jgi:hypothetical protein
MLPEKETKTADNKKQKIMLAITIVIILIVVWNIIGLSGGGGGSETPSPQPPMASLNKPMPTTTAATPVTALPVVNEPKQAPIPEDNDIFKLSRQTQEDYLKDLNQLQLLKVEREITETQVAIASAELNRKMAEHNISEFIINKSGRADLTEENTSAAVPITSNITQPIEQPRVSSYVLHSVSYEGGKWNAVIGFQGKMSTATVGDVLEDGSVVFSINRNAVILKNGNATKKLMINLSI